MNQICVNIACGTVYVNGWKNFDYAPHSSSVIRANLLERLPILDCEVDVVYSSHFLEHIPRNLVSAFLSECFRIAKPAGHVRLVLPDMEELCGAYLTERQCGEHAKADFLVLEMLDQCVRTTTGGELGAYYAQLQSAPAVNSEMLEYVRMRTGHDFLPFRDLRAANGLDHLPIPAIVLGKLEQLYIRALLALLPSAFRAENVSMASVGERHTWIYDFRSVAQLLMRAGFVDVRRVSATTSGITDFPFYPLDVTKGGQARKGAESMYIEAVRS